MNDASSVLRCGQCNKPFDKQSSLKRHGYYCRSQRGGRVSRSRSCATCAKGKTRCDNGQPACSRCRAKGIACHYPSSTAAAAAAKKKSVGTPRDGARPIRQQDCIALGDCSDIGGSMLGAMATDADAGTAASTTAISLPLQLIALESDWAEPVFSFVDMFEAGSDLVASPPSASAVCLSSASASTGTSASTSTSICLTSEQTIKPQQTAADATTTTDPTSLSPARPTNIPPLMYRARSMIPRPKMGQGAQRVVTLICHTLRSYTVMMLRHKTLPPFVHPQVLSPGNGRGTGEIDPDSMETLTNCVSLVGMISTGVQGSRKLFWKNVKLECERLCLEYEALGRWELLAAMDALSLYILVRLQEGETEHNDIDFLLLTALIIVSQHFGFVCRTMDRTSLRPCWENWIYEESRRRLVVLYRILNILVYFEPAEMCILQSDLILAPLPAKKQLWEAGDASKWQEEAARNLGVESDYGLNASGDLVRMHAGQDYCCSGTRLLYEAADKSDMTSSSQGSTSAWDDWCSGIDGFGGLVMLAALVVASR